MRLFPREDIGDNQTLYLKRWILIRMAGCALYLHRFERSDWSRDLHDHPRAFITVPLLGGYWNETEQVASSWAMHMALGPRRIRILIRWPWPRYRPATHAHRVELDPRWPHPWTLVLMLRKSREWGFFTPGGWVRWDEYVARLPPPPFSETIRPSTEAPGP